MKADMRVHLASGGLKRKFIKITQSGDWSLIIAFDRQRQKNSESSRYVLTSGSQAPIPNSAPPGPSRLTYHTSGQINYHGLGSGSSAYFEPLGAISAPRTFLGISVPNFERLDPAGSREPEAVLQLPEMLSSRFCIELQIAPRGQAPIGVVGAALTLSYDVFALHVIIGVTPVQVPIGLEGHFLYLRPEGPFQAIQATPRTAQLLYNRAKSGDTNMIYGPDGEGRYTLFTTVEMRATPKLTVEFSEPGYEAVLDAEISEPHKVCFHVRGKSGWIKQDVRNKIASIILDAEFD